VDTFDAADLATGRLTDWASTKSATTVGAHVLRTNWIDINGNPESDNEGAIGALWNNSAGGPTRDGRLGIAATTPGQNIFATYGTTSYWETFQFNLIQDGGGWYGRQGATSGASPIAVGAAALMLQLNPWLTSAQFRQFVESTATHDSFTGATPNVNWGYGKINILGAIEQMCGPAPIAVGFCLP
jgi:minor extracellular serine protease Vpr